MPHSPLFVFKSILHSEPAVVRNLAVTVVTTSSVSLDWNEPEGNTTSYFIQWISGGGAVHNTSTNETSMIIEGLIAGSQYNITVAAVAGDSNEGERTPVTTFTSRFIL